MDQRQMGQLLRDASLAENPEEAAECRAKFVEAFRDLDHWTQCVLIDVYDEVLRCSQHDLPEQFIFYMFCRSQFGTTEHGLGALDQELLEV